MLRDPVIQSARLMPTEEEGEGQGEESENPLVGPGITITQPDKIQPIKVSHVYHMHILHAQIHVPTYIYFKLLCLFLER